MIAHFNRFVAQRGSAGLIILPQEVELSVAIEELLMVWAASDASEWINRRSFIPL